MALKIDGWESDNQEVTDLIINQVEQMLGIKLPKSYVALMKKWNGGCLPDEHQVLVKGDVPENLKYYLGDGFWSLSNLAGISSDVNNREGIVYSAQTAHEWRIPEKVIAFDGDGHTWLAFDYRGNSFDEPRIIFIESDDLLSFDLASNFTDFVDQLIPSSDVYDYDGNIIYKP